MRSISLFLLLCLFCLDAPSQSTQTPSKQPQPVEEVSQDDVVRVDTTLVGVPFTVLDREGRWRPKC